MRRMTFNVYARRRLGGPGSQVMDRQKALVTTEGGDESTCRSLARWKARRAFRGYEVTVRVRTSRQVPDPQGDA